MNYYSVLKMAVLKTEKAKNDRICIKMKPVHRSLERKWPDSELFFREQTARVMKATVKQTKTLCNPRLHFYFSLTQYDGQKYRPGILQVLQTAQTAESLGTGKDSAVR